jgi:hypothetical protein
LFKDVSTHDLLNIRPILLARAILRVVELDVEANRASVVYIVPHYFIIGRVDIVKASTLIHCSHTLTYCCHVIVSLGVILRGRTEIDVDRLHLTLLIGIILRADSYFKSVSSIVFQL